MAMRTHVYCPDYHHRILHSFPTRRSSDLSFCSGATRAKTAVRSATAGSSSSGIFSRDRKSTRLNSSHSQISYAVFCLKKKKKKQTNTTCKHERRTSRTTLKNHCHTELLDI